MRVLRYLIRSINPLNLLLLVITAAAVLVVLLPLMKMNAKYSLPQVKPRIAAEAEKPPEKSGSILPSDYTVIGDLNLFHPERRVPIEKKADEVPRPELILYGTMVQNNVQYAFIEDKKNPQTTPGRGSRQTTIKKGDVIGGFVVSEIGIDRITLTKGDDKMVVLLASADKRNGSATTPIAPAQAVPGSPFAPAPGTTNPMPQIGGRPTAASPGAIPARALPQPLSRPAVPGPDRAGPGPTPIR